MINRFSYLITLFDIYIKGTVFNIFDLFHVSQMRLYLFNGFKVFNYLISFLLLGFNVFNY